MKEWVGKADEDLALAQRELRVRNAPALSAICFHSQQAAEKHLKAVLCALGKEVLRTHDLVALLHALAADRPQLLLLEPALKRLTEYAVRYRYPGASADRREARQAVEHALEVRAAVSESLRLTPLRGGRLKPRRRTDAKTKKPIKREPARRRGSAAKKRKGRGKP